MTDKPKFTVSYFNSWKPIIVKSTEIPKEETPLDKETQVKMLEYILKNNSTKSLKELIKKFYKK